MSFFFFAIREIADEIGLELHAILQKFFFSLLLEYLLERLFLILCPSANSHNCLNIEHFLDAATKIYTFCALVMHYPERILDYLVYFTCI